MKIYVTYICNFIDIVWTDVETILHEKIINHKIKISEFKIKVCCEKMLIKK